MRRDLFLDERARLTEQERALISAMLGALVEQIADELRLGLPAGLHAEAEADRAHLLARLWNRGALDRPILIALLVRRADEQAIATARQGSGAMRAAIVEEMVADEDGHVASAAMALALARGRRRDRFGRIGVEFDDVPAEEAVDLVNIVAAAMRHGMTSPAVAVDEALATAGERLLQRHDEGRRVEMRCAALAAALVDARGPDDRLVTDLAATGDAALLAALCAVRGGLGQDTAWALLVDSGPEDAMLLARLAGLGRAAAAAMVASLGEPLLWGDAGDAIGAFDGLDAGAVEAARRWWRLPASYRAARASDGGGDGPPAD